MVSVFAPNIRWRSRWIDAPFDSSSCVRKASVSTAARSFARSSAASGARGAFENLREILDPQLDPLGAPALHGAASLSRNRPVSA